MKNQFILLFALWITGNYCLYGQSSGTKEKLWDVNTEDTFEVSDPGSYVIRLKNFKPEKQIKDGSKSVTITNNSFTIELDAQDGITYPGGQGKLVNASISFIFTGSDKQLTIKKSSGEADNVKKNGAGPVSKGESYISFEKNLISNADCVDCAISGALEIIYDVSLNKIIFPVKEHKESVFSKKGAKEKYFLKMLPVDRVVQVMPVHYNPYTDSIAVSVEFDNKNLESQALFSGLFTPQSREPEASDGPKKTPDGAGLQAATAPERKTELAKLNAELIEFRKAALAQPAIDVDKLAGSIAKMLDAINQKFELNISSGSEFAKSYKTKNNPDADEQKLVDEVAINLDKVLKFNRASALPVQIENADISIFNFSSFRGGKKNGQFKYQFFNKNGFKIDFSTGLFVTGLIDEKYTFGATASGFDTTRNYTAVWDEVKKTTIMKDSITGFTTPTRREIIRDSRDKFNIGLGVLLHAYSRWGKRLNLGCSVGGMIDNQTNIKYTGGGTILLGREQRLVLTYGIALGKINKLGNGLKEGDFVSPSTNQTVPIMEAKWASSWFFGVTYNLGTVLNK